MQGEGQEHLYQQILELLEDGFLRADKKGKITMANYAIAKLCGFKSSDAMIGLPMTKLYKNSTDRDVVINDLKKDGIVVNREIELKKKNGNSFWSLCNIKFVYDENGELTGTEGVIRDISKIKRAEIDLHKVNHDMGERIKELNCLYDATKVISQIKNIDEILQSITDSIPPAWHYPDITSASISYNNKIFKSKNFTNTQWCQSADIIISNQIKGQIKVCYHKKTQELDEGPFMKEERELINTLATYIGLAIEDVEMRQELDASYQQLQAHEQQLQAMNQQLRAGNQQLSANEQQLRATNQQLNASELRFRKTIESISEGFFILETGKLIVTYYNQAAEEILGKNAEEVMNKALFKSFPEAKGSIFEENFLNALKTQKAITFETYFEIDPYVNWYRVRVYPRDEQVSVFIQVITEQKFYEQHIKHLNRVLYAIRQVDELIKHEHNKEKLLSQSIEILVKQGGYFNAWIALLNEKDDVDKIYATGVDKEFKVLKKQLLHNELTQCGKKVLKTQGVVVIKDAQNACYDCPLKETYKGRAAMSLKLFHADRLFGILTVSVPVDFTTEQDQDLVRSVADDLSIALMKIEYEKQHDRLLQAVNALPQPISIIDKEYRYLSVNKAYKEIYQRELGQIIGHKITDFISEEVFITEIKPHLDKAIKGGQVKYEVNVDFESGKRWMLMNYMPYYSSNGEIIGVIAVGNDITERKIDETKLQAANQQLIASEQQLQAGNQQLRASEKQLRINEERYVMAQKIGKVGNWEYDLKTERFWGSVEAKRIYGFDPFKGDFSTEHVESCIPERKRVHKALIDLIEKRKPYDLTFDIITKDKNVKKTIHSIAELKIDGNNVPLKVMGSIHDVTEQAKIYNQLSDQEHQLRLLVDNLVDIVWQMDLKLNFTYVSPSIYAIFGYTPEEWVGSNLAQHATRKEFLHMAGQAFGAIKEYKNFKYATFQSVMLRKDGAEVPVEIIGKLILNSKGLPIGLQGSTRDISDRKKAEDKLILQTKRLQEAETMAHIGHMSFNILKNKITWSDEVFNIYKRSKSSGEPGMHEFVSLHHSEDIPKLEKAMHAAKEKCESQSLDLRLVSDKYDMVYTHHIIKPVCNAEGRVIQLSGTIQDVSERKKHEQELLNAKQKAEENDRLKSAFLANMSHEIRTPMNGILGFTQLLQNKEIDGERRQKYLEVIRISGKRMLDTVNDLISISMIETGQVKVYRKNIHVFDLCQELFNFFKPMAVDKGLELKFESTKDIEQLCIYTDESKLNSIITNLIKNALKYTDSGSVLLKIDQNGSFLNIAVKDTGIGIPEEKKEAIFDRFIQADVLDKHAREGSGLGLTIVKAYVDMIGGSIEIDTREGHGSTFSISIPIDEVNKHSYEKKNIVQESLTEIKPGLKILIVEDDDISHEHLSIILRSMKAELLHAGNGKQACQIAKKHPELDAILMDIKMPLMSGYEALEKIRVFNKTVPIIAQTAYAYQEDRKHALESGFDAYISKPIDKIKLQEVLNQLIK